MKPFAIALILSSLPVFASAATMTFKDIPKTEPAPRIYTENGIVAEGKSYPITEFATPEAAHLDDGGAPYPRGIEFSMAGRFDAVSFDLSSGGFNNDLIFDDGADLIWIDDVTFDNVLIQGLRSGAVVAETVFNSGPWTRSFTSYTLEGFTNLDSVYFGFTERPAAHAFTPPPGYEAYFWCDSPCSHYDLDNVVLEPVSAAVPAPVPLPSTMPLILAALGGLGMLGRKRVARVIAAAS